MTTIHNRTYPKAVQHAVWSTFLSGRESEPTVSDGYISGSGWDLSQQLSGGYQSGLGLVRVTRPGRNDNCEVYLVGWQDCQSNLVLEGRGEDLEPVSVDDMVQLIKEVFGLSAVQVANILGISRPALYNHLSGKEAPRDLSSYEALFHTAHQVWSSIGRTLKPGLKSYLVDGKTLLGHLNESFRNTELIVDYARKIDQKLQKNKVDPGAVSAAEQKLAVFTIGKSA